MHVLEYGLEGIEELVLDACVVSLAYDTQCEGNRALWLFDMFKNAPEYGRFSEFIVAALKSDSDDNYNEQLCDLACLMAKSGDANAGAALRDFVWGQSASDGFAGGRAIIALDGVPGAIELARRLGRILVEKPDEYLDSLEYLVDDSAVLDEAYSALKSLALNDQAIAAYLAMEINRIAEKNQRESETPEQIAARRTAYREKYLLEYPVDRIIREASNHQSESKYLYSRFGRYARDEDLELILNRINMESDAETCLRLLWIFGKNTRLPRLDDRVWTLASDPDSRIRVAAIKALATLCNPRIGHFARQLLVDGSFDAERLDEIELFVNNYQEGDEALILAALENLNPNDDDAHYLGMSLLRICENNDCKALACLAKWIYQTNPCTICRNSAVAFMLQWGDMPSRVADECRFDASYEIREQVNN